MLMKAGCSNNQCYVDRFTSSFVRVIQRLAREHNGSSNVETIGMSFLMKTSLFNSVVTDFPSIFVCFMIRCN